MESARLIPKPVWLFLALWRLSWLSKRGPKEFLDELGLRKSLVRKAPRPPLTTTGLVGIIWTQMLALECKVKSVFSSGRECPTLKLVPHFCKVLWTRGWAWDGMWAENSWQGATSRDSGPPTDPPVGGQLQLLFRSQKTDSGHSLVCGRLCVTFAILGCRNGHLLVRGCRPLQWEMKGH